MKKNSNVVVIKEFQVDDKTFKIGHEMRYITRLRTGANILADSNATNILADSNAKVYLECSDETLKNFKEVVEGEQ